MDGSVVKNDFCLSEGPHSIHSIHVGRATLYCKISVYILSSDSRSKAKTQLDFYSPVCSKANTPNVVKSYYFIK